MAGFGCSPRELWAALDALGLKALAIVIGRRLDFPRSCYHVAGKNGQKRGAKAAVRHICRRLPPNQFLFRSDVKSYYASIDHAVLLTLVRDRIDDWRGARSGGTVPRQNDRRKLSLRDCDAGHQPRLSVISRDGGALSGAAGPPDGGHRPDLRPVYGRLGDPGPHAVESSAGGSDRQRDAPGTACGATSGQDLRGED